MANYNQRLNKQVYTATAALTTAQLNEDRGAFFGSVLATLNHVLTGDLLWLSRFRQHPSAFGSLKGIEEFPAFVSLDQLAFGDLNELTQSRIKLDELIISWIKNDVAETDFHKDIAYTDTKGTVYKRNFGELLAHFFNHQTHHRGQVSTLLMQYGHDIGVTDFLIDIPSTASNDGT